jgi:hypothetical protein
MQQRHEGPRHKTALTSGQEEDAPWGHQAEPTSGDCQDSSRVFHQTMGTGKWDTVEVLAPAKVEQVVP